MAKIFSGSTLSYGSQLPPSAEAVNGALFFLVDAYTDATYGAVSAGLYAFTFQKDVNTVLAGSQVGQRWQQLTSMVAGVSKTGDTMTGSLSVQGAIRGTRGIPTDDTSAVGFSFIADGDTGMFSTGTNGIGADLSFYLNAVERLKITSSTVTIGGNTVFHQGNQSSINAGALNGQSASYYTNLANATGTLDLSQTTGLLSVNRGGTGGTMAGISSGAIIYAVSAGALGAGPVGTAGQVLVSGGTGAPSWTSAGSIGTGSSSTLSPGATIAIGGSFASAPPVNFTGGSPISLTLTVNNSTQVAGLSPTYASLANTVAARDASAHLYAAYYNQSSPAAENPVISQVIVTTGDGFFRKASLAHFQASLGLGGAGDYVARTGDAMTGALRTPNFATGGATMPSGGGISSQGNIISGGSLSSTSVSTGTISTSGVIASGAGISAVGNITTQAAVMATGDIIAYSSDARLKTNVSIIPNALEKIGTLGGYEYDWDLEKSRRLGFTPTNKHEHGLIAQEVQKVMPDAVAPAPFNSDYLTVKYERLVALLVAAMNEQQQQIVDLQNDIASLRRAL